MKKIFLICLLFSGCNEGLKKGWTKAQVNHLKNQCINNFSVHIDETVSFCDCWINSFATSMSYEDYNRFIDGASEISMQDGISPAIIVDWLTPIIDKLEVATSKIESKCCNSSKVDYSTILSPLKYSIKYKKLIDMGFNKAMDFNYFINKHPELLNDFPEFYYEIRIDKEISINQYGEIFFENLSVDREQLSTLLKQEINEDSRVVFSILAHPKAKISDLLDLVHFLDKAGINVKFK